MIFLDGYNYGTGGTNPNGVHGDLVVPPYERHEYVQTFWGVIGAAVMYSQPTVRILTCDFTAQNFTDEIVLRQHIAELQSHISDNGTLIVNGTRWPLCAFLGFTPNGPPFKDGSGVHGWVQFGRLAFRQIAS